MLYIIIRSANKFNKVQNEL